MHQSFFNYRHYRYAIRSGALAVVAILAYVFCPLREPRSGGTWLGYTLGTIAALLIVCLAWYGVRRRTFRSGGSAAGWLSAHGYFGFVLMLVATLYCGFQFGWNVHTAAYVLLALVVLSGAWGTYAYTKYPSLIIKQRGNISRAELVEEIYQLDGRAIRVVSVLPARASMSARWPWFATTRDGAPPPAGMSTVDSSCPRSIAQMLPPTCVRRIESASRS